MALGDTVLREGGKEGKEVKASELWAEGPVLVVVLRRPGCLLCREQAIKVWSERAQFEALGVGLVCIVHEWLDREIAAFQPDYWGGRLLLDADCAFNAAVHGGAVKKGSLLDLLNPFSRAYKNVKRAKASGTVKDSNFTGDGMTLGGTMVVRRGGAVEYSYAEQTFGDHPDFAELLAAAAKAGGSSK